MTITKFSIEEFALANPLYIGATVTFYTVDINGLATTTLASLFADPAGTIPATNPQILDGFGKFKAPVYVGVAVIAKVFGPRVTAHSTGVITSALIMVSPIPVDNTVAKAYPDDDTDQVHSSGVSGHILAPLDQNVIHSGNGVFPFSVLGSNPLVSGLNATIVGASAGRVFALRFSSAFIAGSPITVSYTATDASAVNTATGLCNAIIANAVLHSPTTKLPIIADPITGGGTFNLQWDVHLTDLTVTDVSTGGGSITLPAPVRTLDFSLVNVGRYIPGYFGQDGDAPIGIELWGQNSGGALAGTGLILTQIIDATNFTTRMYFETASNFVGTVIFALQNGAAIFDNGAGTGALPVGGFKGRGTLNVPTGGGQGYYAGGNKVVDARKTGWATATGTPTRTAFDTSSVTLPQLAERVKALIDDLHATAGHGLIGP